MASDPVCVRLEPRWESPCIVAATGESLTPEVASICQGYPAIAVKEAWHRLPWAGILYNYDAHWWEQEAFHAGFQGEKWTALDGDNYRTAVAYRLRLHLVEGRHGQTFSEDPAYIYLANNSGFQAIGIAIHLTKEPKRIVLVGFDMQNGYFYGRPPFRESRMFGHFLPMYEEAGRHLPAHIEIINATMDSALEAFPKMSLEQALAWPSDQ